MAEKLRRDEISFQMKLVNDIVASWKSQVIFVLHKIGVFRVLEGKPSDIEYLSKGLEIPKESLDRLLAAGVSLGYIKKRENLYYNSDQVSQTLVPQKPGYMGNWLELNSRWYDSFGKLEDAVRRNKAIENVNFQNDASYKKLFIKGMIDYAQFRGRDILNHIDLSDKKLMLDVGCGPGVYAALFCEKYLNLTIHCVDLRHALKIAKEYLAERPKVFERIELIECDYHEVDAFKFGYDVIFLSHVLHQENEENSIKLLKKSYDALKPGGLVIVQAMFSGSKGMTSTYAFLHDLLSLLIFPEGKNYSIEYTIQLMRNVGLQNVRHKNLSLFNVNSLVLGEKL
jgi:cyclopropane fatty-acyl-phospholipid synthase-like methyltransferase